MLVTIVVVGVLTAVAIVGIAGLTDKGGNAACATSYDAAKAATLAYYSNTGGNYPQTFSDLTSSAERRAAARCGRRNHHFSDRLAGQGRMDLDHASGSNHH